MMAGESRARMLETPGCKMLAPSVPAPSSDGAGTETRANKVIDQITIPADKFDIVEAELKSMMDSTPGGRCRSDKAWQILKKHGK